MYKSGLKWIFTKSIIIYFVIYEDDKFCCIIQERMEVGSIKVGDNDDDDDDDDIGQFDDDDEEAYVDR